MTEIQTEREKPIARPLRILVPLIKKDLQDGNEAAERAGLPYYRAAGDKLLEAKAQIRHGEFTPWVLRNFAIRRALEPLEKAAAKQRMTLGKISTGSATGKTRDKIGAIAGISGRQVEKIAEVVEAAEKEPQQFGHLMEIIDSPHGVSKAYYALRRARDQQRVLNLAPVAGEFRALVVDPPWAYPENDVLRGAVPYATMQREEILALPVPSWAEDDCHLYLWTTNARVPLAVECVAAWGFEYRTMLTWAKPHYGLGKTFRGQTEHVLFGFKGTLRTRCTDISTLFHAPTGGHSAKPEKFYEIVRAASYPPYGEAFQREPRPDFVNLFAEAPPPAIEAAQ